MEPTPTPASAQIPPATSGTATVQPSMIDDNTKQQMIQAMAQQSGMNLDWSQK